MNELFPLDPSLITTYFRLAMAWLICLVVFYSVVSYAVKKRWLSIAFSVGFSTFCYEQASRLLNHTSQWTFWIFLALFFIILVYQAYSKAKIGKLGW